MAVRCPVTHRSDHFPTRGKDGSCAPGGDASLADYPDRLLESVIALSNLLLSEERLDTTLERVAVLACETIAGCDGCGVTLVSPGGPSTAAASDETVRTVDGAQYEHGAGPCLSAYRERRTVRIDSISDDDRWPAVVAAAAENDIHSVMSFPLVVRDVAIGALNVYSRTPNAFSPEAERMGRLFADQAAVALANAQTHDAAVDLATNLEHALESRATIDQAIGVTVARYGGTPDEAFVRLRELSQRENLKLRDVALRVLEDAERASTRTDRWDS
jgi:transcriptional regulator with GAF, ATPase, and Fis domain